MSKTIKTARIQTKLPEDIHKKIVEIAVKEYEGNKSQAVRKLLANALEQLAIDQLKQ